jgi:hypothetical protein
MATAASKSTASKTGAKKPAAKKPAAKKAPATKKAPARKPPAKKPPAKKQSPIEARVAELRKRSKTDPSAAADEAWAWIEELGAMAGSDRVKAEADLNELFLQGKVPTGLDGATEGILVTPLIQPTVDSVVRRITGSWMPWAGKRFNQAEKTGDNVLAGSARWPAKLLWPLYGTTPVSGGRAAFDFNTFEDSGKVDPSLKVLVIDYESVDSNPGLIIKKIRDELVQIVPGANLGKVLWRSGDDDYTNIGFFALRTP